MAICDTLKTYKTVHFINKDELLIDLTLKQATCLTR